MMDKGSMPGPKRRPERSIATQASDQPALQTIEPQGDQHEAGHPTDQHHQTEPGARIVVAPASRATAYRGGMPTTAASSTMGRPQRF